MGQSFIGEIVEGLSNFLLDEGLDDYFSGGVVREWEVYLFIEQLFAVLHGSIERFMTAGDHSDPIGLGPQLVSLHISDDLLHANGNRIHILFLALEP